MTIMNLGSPVPVDPGEIEQELRAFWKRTEEQAEDSPLVRACSCNLVTVVESTDEASAFLPLLGKIAEWHPSRSIIVCLSEGDDASMQAWISAQCTLLPGDQAQVCSETIILSGSERTAHHLKNIILSLVVPDLPVYLYWRSPAPAARKLVEALAPLAGGLLIDSRTAKSAEDKRTLLELVSALPAGTTPRDLDWGRMTVWRDMIAQLFDGPEVREQVERISEVVIQRGAAPGQAPYRSLLLIAWLALRLEWQSISADHAKGEWISIWRSHAGEVRVVLREVACGPGDKTGIGSVTIRTRDGAEFAVAAESHSACLKATSSIKGETLIHTVPRGATDEATLIAQELSLPEGDSDFESVLARSIELAEAFQGG